MNSLPGHSVLNCNWQFYVVRSGSLWMSQSYILQLSDLGVILITPDSHSVVDTMSYRTIVEVIAEPQDDSIFTIVVNTNIENELLHAQESGLNGENGTDIIHKTQGIGVSTHKFSSPHRLNLLCRLMECIGQHNPALASTLFCGFNTGRYKVKRLRKKGTQSDSILTVRPFGIVETNCATGRIVQVYYFFSSARFFCLESAPSIYFTVSDRMKIFTLENGLELPSLVQDINDNLSRLGAPTLRLLDMQVLPYIAASPSNAHTSQSAKISGMVGINKENVINKPPLPRNAAATSASSEATSAAASIAQRKSSPYVSVNSDDTLKELVAQRNGMAMEVNATGPIATFEVSKLTHRYERPMPRQLFFNENFLVEKDSSGFQTVSYRRLHSIFAVVRSWNNAREFSIEFDDGSNRFYSSAVRDSLLSILLDVCHAVGNVRVVVACEKSSPLRMIPRTVSLASVPPSAVGTAADYAGLSLLSVFSGFGLSNLALKSPETCLLTRLKVLTAYALNKNTSSSSSKAPTAHIPVDFGAVYRICVDINSNVAFPGIAPDSDIDLVRACMGGVMQCINSQLLLLNNSNDHLFGDSAHVIAVLLQTLYRIVTCRHGFKGFLEWPGMNSRLLLRQLLQVKNDFVNYWSLEVLKVLCCCPFSPRNVKQEFVNKQTLLSENLIRCVIDLATPSESGGRSTPPAGQPQSYSAADSFPEDRLGMDAGSGKAGRTINALSGPNHLVTMSVSSLLEAALSSHRDTSSPELVGLILDELGKQCVMLLYMVRMNSFIVLENAAILMYILLKHRPSVAPVLKEIALCEGLALKHFYNAVFSAYSTQRYISRFLVSSWMSGRESDNDTGKCLLARIIPRGLVEFLKSPKLSEMQRERLDEIDEEYYAQYAHSQKKSAPTGSSGDASGAAARNIGNGTDLQIRMRKRIARVMKEGYSSTQLAAVARKDRGSEEIRDRSSSVASSNDTYSSMFLQRETEEAQDVLYYTGKDHYYSTSTGKSRVPVESENWRLLFHMITQNHKIPDLIWNEQTRLELRSALELELRNYEREKRLRGSAEVAWNFQQFKISYASLSNEMRVGPIYVRHFLEADETFLRSIENPTHTELFEKLFRRVVGNISNNTPLSILCTRCLVRLYDKCGDKVGGFDDVMLVVKLLEQAHELELQHCLLDLLEQLSLYNSNVLQLFDREFVDAILQFASLAHLNPDQIGNLLARSTRASRSRQLMIEASHEAGSPSSRRSSLGSILSAAAAAAGPGAGAGYEGYNDGLGCTWRDSYLPTEHEPLNGFNSEEEQEEVEEFEDFDKPGSGTAAPTGGAMDASSQTKKENRAMWAPDDEACPRTWYICAKSDIVPPPATLQEGPFRITDLLELWDNGQFDDTYIVAPALPKDDLQVDELHAEKDTMQYRNFARSVDTGRWRRLDEYFQLRIQFIYPGKAVYSPAVVSTKALAMLCRVSLAHKAFDSRGLPFYPIPASRRIMSEPQHLAVLATLLLSNDTTVVETVADLVLQIVRHNKAATSKLYSTGLFYFICRYTGNNFVSLARLLDYAHLCQSTHMTASQLGKEANPVLNSVLSSILPSAAISILCSYGPEKFAEVYTGESDTPEVIWNNEFRMHVVEMIDQHLGVFPARLRQHTMHTYEYIPIPSVHFPDLEKELYVNKYYLKNLCNEKRFPAWPIEEPLALLRDTVERWRTEMAKGVPDTDVVAAAATLGINYGSNPQMGLVSGSGPLDGGELRRAYRSLARRYHPDRNPGGREMFERIQVAYELLSSVELKESETDLMLVLLLLKTQNLLYRRFPEAVRDQKYPAYSLLLKVCNVPTFPVRRVDVGMDELVKQKSQKRNRRSIGFSRDGKAEVDLLGANGASVYLLNECLLLLYHTTTISPLNAREVVRTCAHERLYEILCFALQGRDPQFDATNNTTSSEGDSTGETSEKEKHANRELLQTACDSMLIHSLKAFSGLALTDIGRNAMAGLCPSFSETICSVLKLSNTIPLAVEAALHVISRGSSSEALQLAFVSAGCIWTVVPMLLSFDRTMESINRNERGDTTGAAMSPPRTPLRPQERSPQRQIKDNGGGDAAAAAAAEFTNSSGGTSIFSPLKYHAAVGFDEDQRTVHNQNSCNMHAILAALVLGRLGGYMHDNLASPVQPTVRSAMDALLTPSLAKLLCQSRPWELLRCLNENVESPGRLWSAAMRAELTKFIALQASLREEEGLASRDMDLIATKSFKFECLKTELCIDLVYVRLFNHASGSTVEVTDPARFSRNLLLFLCSYTERTQSSSGGGALTPPPSKGSASSLVSDAQYDAAHFDESQAVAAYHKANTEKDSSLRARHLDQVAEALSLLSHGSESTVTDLASFPRGIRAVFGILCRKYSHARAPCFFAVIKAVHAFSSNANFVKTCSSSEVFPDRFPVLQLMFCACEAADEAWADSLWALVHQFTATSNGIRAFLEAGAVLRLLGVIFGVKGCAAFYANRRNAASLLSKLLLHPQHGADTAVTLHRFLPLPVVQKLRAVSCGDGEASVRCLDESTETPELIWSKEMRCELREVIHGILTKRRQLGGSSKSGPSGSAAVPHGLPSPEAAEIPSLKASYRLVYHRLARELYVGGFYLRSFLKQPTFRLSNPVYALEKVYELWESVLQRVLPKSDESSSSLGSSLRQSILTITAAATSALPSFLGLADSASEAPSRNVTSGNQISLRRSGVSVSLSNGTDYDDRDGDGYRNVTDSQLLLLLTQAIACIVRGEESTMGHLMQWGLPIMLAKRLRQCCSIRSQLITDMEASASVGRRKDSESVAHAGVTAGVSERISAGLASCTVCITCMIDLLNLLCTALHAVDELASGQDNPLISTLLSALDQTPRSARGVLTMLSTSNKPDSPMRPLPLYTSAILKLILRILHTEMSMNLLYYVQAAVNCGLPQFLLDKVIGAPSSAFTDLNVRVTGTGSSNANQAAHAVRSQAVEVLKALLSVDEEEYYTGSLRHLLETHPVWKDVGHQSHALYATADSNIEPLLLLDDADDAFTAPVLEEAFSSPVPPPRTSAPTPDAPLAIVPSRDAVLAQDGAVRTVTEICQYDDEDDVEDVEDDVWKQTLSPLPSAPQQQSRGSSGYNTYTRQTQADLSPCSVSPTEDGELEFLANIKHSPETIASKTLFSVPANPFGESDLSDLGEEQQDENIADWNQQNGKNAFQKPKPGSMNRKEGDLEKLAPEMHRALPGPTTPSSTDFLQQQRQLQPRPQPQLAEEEMGSFHPEDAAAFANDTGADEEASAPEIPRRILPPPRAHMRYSDHDILLIHQHRLLEQAQQQDEYEKRRRQTLEVLRQRHSSRGLSLSAIGSGALPFNDAGPFFDGTRGEREEEGFRSTHTRPHEGRTTTTTASAAPVRKSDVAEVGANAFSGSSDKSFPVLINNFASASSTGVSSRPVPSQDSMEIRTVVRRGSYGWGLDLCKVASGKWEGCTEFVSYKSLPDGVVNLALECTPSLRPGDVVVAVNDRKFNTFVDTVKALRNSRADTVSLTIRRSIL